MRVIFHFSLLLFFIECGLVSAFASRVFTENPDTYLARLKTLAPGDHLHLLPGEYKDGLPIHGLQGSEQAVITISGPENAPYAIFPGRSGHNTVSIVNARYITIQNLVLDGLNLPVDGVKCEGHADWAHDIILEGLQIIRHGYGQQIVGISTKCPAWNWVIRNNRIIGAGTGMYLGDSDGSAAFISGLIENNLITDTHGYNLQIKHQQPRPKIAGITNRSSTTIIRHNVFSKANGGSSEMARPNVLVGHWPLTGVGEHDQYLIYGNLFYQNPNESLFQGEGNIALYNNLFVNHAGSAIRIQPHNDVPRLVDIFYNTIVASDTGISLVNVEGGPQFPQQIAGNAIFASEQLPNELNVGNLTFHYEAATEHLVQPFAALGEMNLAPLSNKLKSSPIYILRFRDYPEWNRDFNSRLRSVREYGAYTDNSQMPYWLPKLELKPAIQSIMK